MTWRSVTPFSLLLLLLAGSAHGLITTLTLKNDVRTLVRMEDFGLGAGGVW
jgi:hypothetical protein